MSADVGDSLLLQAEAALPVPSHSAQNLQLQRSVAPSAPASPQHHMSKHGQTTLQSHHNHPGIPVDGVQQQPNKSAPPQHTPDGPWEPGSREGQLAYSFEAPAAMKAGSGECDQCRLLKDHVKVLTQALASARNEVLEKDGLSRSQAENQRMMLEALEARIKTKDKGITELEAQASHEVDRRKGVASIGQTF